MFYKAFNRELSDVHYSHGLFLTELKLALLHLFQVTFTKYFIAQVF